MPYIPTMPKNRIFLALGVALTISMAAWAQAPSPTTTTGSSSPSAPLAGSVQEAQAKSAAPEPPTDAEKELDRAIARVAALKSVSADLLQTVDMLDQHFQIEGRYLKAPNRRIYLKLKVTGIHESPGTMLQVCDGETLWDYKQILESQSYSKLEIAQILEKLKAPELDDKIREQVLSGLGFSGPEELLKGLRRVVRFDQKSSVTIKDKEYWVLRGEWRSREGLFGVNQQPLPLTAQLPAYVPSLVILHLGKEDGWPYKIRLVGRRPPNLTDTRKIGPDGRPIGSLKSIQEVKPTVMEMTYSNVLLNPDLKTDEFAFQAPPGVRTEDGTQALLGMLDQAIQMRSTQKKAEAAKGEDSLLKQPIEVPRETSEANPSSSPSPSSPPNRSPR
ncbi:MAG: hypothetical protein NVSMB9_33400 [Isosphaeraceae bacterium]